MALLVISPPAEVAPAVGGRGRRTRRSPTVVRRRTHPARQARGGPGHGDRSSPALRLTVRGQAVLAAVVAALVWLLSVDPGAPQVPAERPATVVVQPGQTLWQVAGAIAPSADRRETVDALIEANRLSSAGVVVAGQQLVVPPVR